MKKEFLLIIGFFVLAPAVSANVNHAIDSNQDSLNLNSSIKIECKSDCPVSRWQLTWQIPEDAEVLWVNGTEGEAENVEENKDSILINTRTPPRESEIIRIGLEIDKSAKEVTDGLYRREVNLPGFETEKTTVSIKNKNMISGKAGFGFDTSYSDDEIRALGSGPVNLRWKFGEGKKTEYYEFFGDNFNESIDETYRLSVGTLGVVQNFKRFPVGVLSDREYNISVNSWSAGEYVSGSIRIRDSLEEEFKPVLAHEAVHGLNDRNLRWDGTKSSYFDEGTAKYVEFLMRKKLFRSGEVDIGPAELFGDDKEYSKKEDGREYVYTVRSRGSREKLWNYYDSNMSFMKEWNPFDFSESRGFGYAYSELIIKNHIMNNGTVREIYRKMDFDSEVKSTQEKWRFYSEHLDMTPCKYESREKFENCLDDINSYDYPIYISSPDINNEEIVIEELDLPERKKKDNNQSTLGQFATRNDSSSGFITGIKSFLSSFVEGVSSALGI